MICFIVIFYFLCGVGVALALDDSAADEHGRAILWFLLAVAFWPLMFMFTITLAAKKVAESNTLQRAQITATKQAARSSNQE